MKAAVSFIFFFAIPLFVLAQPRVIGTGTYFGGSVFAVDAEGGNPEKWVDFTAGSPFDDLIVVNGRLWGMTFYGGDLGAGTIFSVESDGSEYRVEHSFDEVNGRGPRGGLILHGERLWGTTGNGGSSGYGVIFSISVNGDSFIKHKDFTYTDGITASGNLYYSNDKIWGMTSGGGNRGVGTIFTIDTDGTNFNKVHDFNHINGTGQRPYGELVESNGKLWGLTNRGGENSRGVIFSINDDGAAYTEVYSFASSEGSPEGSLVESNGKLWGTMTRNESSGYGGIFNINTDGTGYNVVVNMSRSSGSSPRGDLLPVGDRLWGITSSGGRSSHGVVFSISNSDGSGYQYYDLQETNGRNAYGGLVFHESKLFGMTSRGGTTYDGLIFSIEGDGTDLTVLHNFYNERGKTPSSGLIEYENLLYGTTLQGGEINGGVLYSLNKEGDEYVKLHEFQEGLQPSGDLLLHDGVLYGTTEIGGLDNRGTVYSINLDGTGFNTLHEFDYTNGATPRGGLIVVSDFLYGICYGGGVNNVGIIYKLSLDGSEFEVLQHFNSASAGAYPYAGLISTNDKLYGNTSAGGPNGYGTIFSIETDGTEFQVHHGFNQDDGSEARYRLTEINGQIWGTTLYGGTDNRGTLFSMNYDGSGFSLRHNFETSSTYFPNGEIVNYNGQIIGVAQATGTYLYDIEKTNFQVHTYIPDFVGWYLQNSLLIINEKEEQMISFTLSDKTYGDPQFTLSATSNTDNPVSFATSDDQVISIGIDGTTATIENAGEVTITASQEEDETYAATSVDQTITVEKATLTTTASSHTITYGEEEPTYSYSYGDFVNGETAAVLDTQPSEAAPTEEVSGAGDYTVAVSEDGEDNNYEFDYQTGTLTVNKATLTASAVNTEMSYGDEEPDYEISYTGFVSPDTEELIDTPASGVSTSTAVGDAGDYVLQVAEDAEDDNYEFNYHDGTLTVHPRELDITADSQQKVYGEEDPELTYQVAEGGLVGDDALSGAPTRATGEDVGNYAIGRGTLDAGDNYNILFEGDDLAITTREVSISAGGESKTYGDDDPELLYEITDGSLVNDDEFSGELSREEGEDVGFYSVDQNTLTLGDNYELLYEADPFEIQQQAITVEADATQKTYGADDPDLSYTVTVGRLAFDDEFTGELTREAGEAIGNYAISQNTLGLNENYIMTFDGNQFTINKAPLTVTAADQNIDYQEEIPTLTFGYSGFVNGEDETVLDEVPTISTPATNESDAGTYAISLTDVDDDNYEVTEVDGELVINKIDQTITFEAIGDELDANSAPFDLTATASSGLPVAFVSSDEAIASLDGVTVTINAGGQVTFIASQEGNVNYNAAENVVQEITIAQVLNVLDQIPQDISIYPNPVKDQFSLDNGTDALFTKLLLVNHEGRVIWQDAYQSNNQIGAVPNGIYLLMGEKNDQKMLIGKLIKR